MAEFLVYAKNETDDSWDADTVAARQRRGHVLVAKKNKHRWGESETLTAWLRAGNNLADWHSKFVLVKVPALSVTKAAKLTGQAHRPLTSADPEFHLTLPGEPPLPEKLVKKFQWRINFRKLPATARNTLRLTGEITLTLDQLRTLADHNVTRNHYDENAADGRGAERTQAERDDPKEQG